MRSIFLLPLAALVAIAAGCGSEAREQATGSVPERDLTLVTQTPEAEIASPVEMQQLRTQGRTARPSPRVPVRRSRPLEPTVIHAVLVEPAPSLAAAEPVAQPASTPANDRELLPGKTVTLIPTSSGPSTGRDESDELPAARGRSMVAGGGGRCPRRGRGPGIGIAGAPRPDFR